MYGQFFSLKLWNRSQEICPNIFVKISTHFFLVKLIDQCIPGNEGQMITGNIFKYHFYFQHSTQKMETKLGQTLTNFSGLTPEFQF